MRPCTLPISVRRRIWWRMLSAVNSLPGQASSATPVKLCDNSVRLTLRRPRAGSCSTAWLRLTLTSTTKWLNSQCSRQGIFRALSSFRSSDRARVASPSCSAMPVSPTSVTPRVDRLNCRRSAIRSMFCRSGRKSSPGRPARTPMTRPGAPSGPDGAAENPAV